VEKYKQTGNKTKTKTKQSGNEEDICNNVATMVGNLIRKCVPSLLGNIGVNNVFIEEVKEGYRQVAKAIKEFIQMCQENKDVFATEPKEEEKPKNRPPTRKS